MDIVDNLTHIGMLARRVTAAAEVPATVRPILLFECDTPMWVQRLNMALRTDPAIAQFISANPQPATLNEFNLHTVTVRITLREPNT